MVKRVDFDRPPVVEVVCGVGLELSQRLTAGHVGLFWHSIQDKFPNIEEAPPLPELTQAEAVKIEFSSLPPLPRTWLLSEDGSRLVQIQGDRFLYNWKRDEEGAAYPSFDKVYAEFQEYFDKFIKFLDSFGLGTPEVQYLELQYVNHIGAWNGLDLVGGTGVLVDHKHIEDAARFLPAPETFGWQSNYLLPDGQGQFHLNARTAKRRSTGEKLVRLDLGARGQPKDASAESFDSWFELAHDWIVQGFCDLTAPELHKFWGRTR